MTIRTKRRGWRSLAAILAAMLMASVLAVVAGAPAQAANTSDEHMIDTNDDGKKDSREFAGADRYETSLKLAHNYAGGDLGSVSTVIVASGETLIDAVTSAGLAGYKDAPVLLTRSAGISRGVANYIEDHGVGQVIVVGGAASVPDAVLEEIKNLASEPTVMRIAGDDRAATAAAVASELGGNATWCGTDESVAVVVNGSDMPAVDAIAVGPMAYALELPVLLTDSDALPDSTSNFLMDEKIERVVIVGGMASVSADVADEISELGNIAVQRIAGDSAAATSVEIAELMLDDCDDDLGTSSTRVALVNREATADGISSAPVLGKGMGDGPIPVLLVDSELPASVRDYLASTPEQVGPEQTDPKTNLTIIAIGGNAVVSEAVMEAAIATATSSDPLTAEIKAAASAAEDNTETDVDETKGLITITFSDGINDLDEFKLAAKLKDVLYVNSAPASIGEEGGELSITDPMPAATATCGPSESLMVTLTHGLKAGDEIEIRPTATQFGDDDDKRPLQPASFTVPTPDRDTAAPSLEVIAVEGGGDIHVISSEAGNADATKISVTTRSGVKVSVAAAATPEAAEFPAVFGAVRFDFETMYASDNTVGDDPEGSGTDGVTTSGAYNLVKGDIVVLNPGAIKDEAENANRTIRETVDARTKSFTVSSIRLSAVNPGVDDDPTNDLGPNAVPDSIAGVSTPAKVTMGAVTIQALWDGSAAGAAGNGWTLTVDSAAGRDTAAETPEIDVSVNSRNSIIRVRFMDGTPKVSDLLAALNGSSDFTRHFKAVANCANANNGADDANKSGESLTGGLSSVAFMVTFNDYVEMLTTDDNGNNNLRDDILSALVTKYSPASVADTAENLSANTPYTAAVRFLRPLDRVHMLFTTNNAGTIPGARTGTGRGVVDIGGDDEGDDSDEEHVANSYFPENLETLKVDEKQNAAKELRISSNRSVLVK
ncbi:cell wall-binding repeat-containing protein [Candidatus Poriferisodalis sp.]|uniref:cell wall-binding repeat-containing protein n=1 Tax=Candidatus Poriferisodalis sp. TaxID=3101277 RepID=UPI003B52AEDE